MIDSLYDNGLPNARRILRMAVNAACDLDNQDQARVIVHGLLIAIQGYERAPRVLGLDDARQLYRIVYLSELDQKHYTSATLHMSSSPVLFPELFKRDMPYIKRFVSSVARMIARSEQARMSQLLDQVNIPHDPTQGH